MLVWNLKDEIVDVETASLHGELKLEIFMEIPECMDATKEDFLSLNKTIQHLVQSATPICWRSKGQKGVTLSRNEAKYAAISETVKEIRFVYYLLVSLGISVKRPIIVRTDEIGEFFIVENSPSGDRTR
jgi:hypothetical protein